MPKAMPSVRNDADLYFSDSVGWAERLAHAGSIDYWRTLCPKLSITATPFARSRLASTLSAASAHARVKQVVEDGYFRTPPAVPPPATRRLAAAVAAVVAAGFHPLFAIVFDEFWQLLATLAPALEPILGPGPRLIPDFWLWHVDPAADRAGSAPHRDAGYSGTLRSDGRPTLITVWLPLTDATPSNSCIYVLPLSRDPNYPVPRNVPIDASLQDIRALPAAAGSILGWNQHILHWGSRSCPEARHPRISWAMYFQSADVPDFDPLARRLSGPLSFELRLGYIGAALAIYSTRVPLPPPLKAFVLLSKRFLDSP